MHKNFKLSVAAFCFSFIILIFGNYVIIAQTVMTGDWKATYNSEKDDKIQLSFYHQTERGKSQHGSSFDLRDLQGLSLSQISASDAQVRFSLAREAGNIDLEGKFTNGKGAGTFRFTPNRNFIEGMRSRGFALTDEKLFTAATLNLTLSFVDDLKSANFGNLDVDDLLKARIFNITPAFIQEMKATGFANLDMEDLVKARIFKIDAGFVREVGAMGFNKEPLESLVKMRIFNVTPEFIGEVRNAGFKNLDVEDYVKMRIFKIDSAFIRRAKSGNPNITVEEMVRMRIGAPSR